MEALFATSPAVGLLIVRVVLGIIFFAHGAQKVFGWFGGHGLKAAVNQFVSTGLPMPIAYLVCFIELLSGLGLIVGLLTRLCGLGVAVVMIGAIATVHGQHGFFLNVELKPGKGHGVEFALALLAMGLALLIDGGGALALDRLIAG